jgi:hypothetical protein
MSLFRLDWYREVHGRYELMSRKLPSKKPRPAELFIERTGDQLRRYPPFEVKDFCRKLAAHPATADGALDLVKTWGFLFCDGDALREPAALTISGIERLRDLIRLAGARDWRAMEATYLRTLAPLAADWPLPGTGSLVMDFAATAPEERPTFWLRPTSLYDAAVAQLLYEVAVGRSVRLCARPGCGKWFEYGPGTGRRETALYCSRQCTDAASYLKRKGAQHEGLDHPAREKVVAAKVRPRPRSRHR